MGTNSQNLEGYQLRVLLTSVFGPYAQDDEYGIFEVNGPSLVRVVRTTLAGWQRYKNHPDPRIRRRFEWSNVGMATNYAALVAATRHYYRRSPAMHAAVSRLLDDLHREFGWISRFFAAIGGPYLYWTARPEEKRLSGGWTYEPQTFYEHNDAAFAMQPDSRRNGARCKSVTPRNVAACNKTVLFDRPLHESVESPAATTSDA